MTLDEWERRKARFFERAKTKRRTQGGNGASPQAAESKGLR